MSYARVAITQPAKFGPQDVPRTSPSNVTYRNYTTVPRTSQSDVPGTSNLTSWGRPEMTSRGRPNLMFKRHRKVGKLIRDVPRTFSGHLLKEIHSTKT